MKTSTKLIIAAVAVGGAAYAYRRGVDNIDFSLDGFQPAADGAGLLVRIKAVNRNRLFGYPVPQMLVNVLDANHNYLGSAINQQLQYIPANGVSFVYAVVQPNYNSLISLLFSIISTGTLPTDLMFNGIIQAGPVQIPFDTGYKISGLKQNLLLLTALDPLPVI